MHYLYRYVCILKFFFICVYGQLSAIKNLLLLLLYYKEGKNININAIRISSSVVGPIICPAVSASKSYHL